MNILICIDNKFVMPGIVMLKSLIHNNDDNIVVYIMYSDLNNKSIQELKTFSVENNRLKLKFIEVIEDRILKMKTSSKRWPKEVLFRLLAGTMIDDDIDRLLYLDADIIINNNIRDFYFSDFQRHSIVTCEDILITTRNEYSSRLKIPDHFLYFSAGVILMDFKRIKKKLNMDKIMDVIEEYNESLKYNDQDILNILFHNDNVIKDYKKYNFLCDRSRYLKKHYKIFKVNAKIFHFGGGDNYKPWSYKYLEDLGYIWWRYALDTKYKDLYFNYKLKNCCYRIIYKIKKPFVYIKEKMRQILKIIFIKNKTNTR